MEQLRKVVAIGCLTYFLYGLISWFQLGVFLPPLPVKPFLYIGFAVFGLASTIKTGLKTLDISFYLWLVLIAVINQSFLELILSNQQLFSFQESIEIVFQLIAVVLFIVVNSLIILSFQRMKSIFAIYFLILISLVILIFARPNYVGLEESLIGMGALYFLSSRFIADKLNDNVERIVIVFTGVSLIELVEMIALNQ